MVDKGRWWMVDLKDVPHARHSEEVGGFGWSHRSPHDPPISEEEKHLGTWASTHHCEATAKSKSSVSEDDMDDDGVINNDKNGE